MKKKKLTKNKNVIEIPSSVETTIITRYSVKSKKCDSCGFHSSFKFYNNSYLCVECFYMDRRGISRFPDHKNDKRKNSSDSFHSMDL
jgi:hypothetical protein